VHRKINELAARAGVSNNQFIPSAGAEKMASVMTLDNLRTESAQGQRKEFLTVLDHAADWRPLPGDERL